MTAQKRFGVLPNSSGCFTWAVRNRNAFEGPVTREDGRWIVGRTSGYRLEGMVVNVYAPNTVTEHRVFLRELQG